MAKIMSHWCQLLEGLAAQPSEFYASVTKAVERREISEIAIEQVEWTEAGLGSAARQYLRVSRGRHAFDVCGAPFGKGFFASSWLLDRPSKVGPLAVVAFFFGVLIVDAIAFGVFGIFLGVLMFLIGNPALFVGFVWYMNNTFDGWDDFLADLPFIGSFYQALFRPDTFYKIDTAMMFQASVHGAVMEVLDEMTTAKGVRTLTESERKPVMQYMTAGAGR